jgi:hypothetical protein
LFLTIVGCRKKEFRHAYKWGERAAFYIAQRDGDCVDPLPPLRVEEFEELFPKTNLSFLEKEPGLGVIVEDGTVRSKQPRRGLVCGILGWMEERQSFVGLASLGLMAVIVVSLSRKKRAENQRRAGEIAAHAHRILATTDRAIYQYDLKVQLTAKFGKVERIWGSIVKAIEENPHVCVGVAGSRHEIYWRWIRSDG